MNCRTMPKRNTVLNKLMQEHTWNSAEGVEGARRALASALQGLLLHAMQLFTNAAKLWNKGKNSGEKDILAAIHAEKGVYRSCSRGGLIGGCCGCIWGLVVARALALDCRLGHRPHCRFTAHLPLLHCRSSRCSRRCRLLLRLPFVPSCAVVMQSHWEDIPCYST